MADQGSTTLTVSFEGVMAAPAPPRSDQVGAPEREISTPGSVEHEGFRPMTIGEMLLEGARLYRRHWKGLMLTAGLVNGPFILIWWSTIGMAAGGGASARGGSAEDSAVSGIFTATNNVLVRPLVYAAMLSAVAAVCLGQAPRVGRAYRIAVDRLGSVLWVMVLALLGMGIAEAVGRLALYAPGGVPALRAEGGVLALRVVVALVALGIIAVLYVRWAVFAITIVVIEGARGKAALGRAWSLSAGAFWKITLVMLAAHLPILAVDTLLKLTGETLSSSLGSFGWAAQGVAAAISAVVVTPYNVLIAVLLYVDQWLCKETVGGAPSAVTHAPEPS
jgi:hypothetical protein